MSGGVLGGVIFLWIIPILIAVSQGRAKNRAGLAYGFFLGWLGVIILALLPLRRADLYGECPFCREDVRLNASVCPHCRREIASTRQPRPTS